MRHLAGLVAAVVTAGVLSSCTSAEQDEAAGAADAYAAAIDAKDGAAACAALAPATVAELEQSAQKQCAQAVLDEATPPGARTETQTYGSMSRVRFEGDVVFVGRYGDGWKVVAASCEPRPDDAPYDCGIEGR